jgi:hypothetical protein
VRRSALPRLLSSVSRPRCRVGATALETGDAHAHGNAHASALADDRHPRWAACNRTRADTARADLGGSGGTSHRGMRESELATDLDTKKPGVHAAPPGESLFSSLFSVAARGGKSPRESIVLVSLRPARSAVKPLSLSIARLARKCTTPYRPASHRHAIRRTAGSCDDGPPSIGRSVDVEALARATLCDTAKRHEVSSRLASVARTFRSSASDDSLPDDPLASPPLGDLTVTTRPGVVAFSRSTFSRLALPCSGGGAPCGATDGAKLQSGSTHI